MPSQPIALRLSNARREADGWKRKHGKLVDHVRKLSRPRKFAARMVKRRTGTDDLIRVIMPDSHGAYADPMAMALFIDDLKRIQPAEIIMLGDHVDCGGHLAQHHVIGYIALGAYSYADDISACNQHLDAIRAAAPNARIHYIEGNHEARIERWCMEETIRNSKDAEFLRQCYSPEALLGLAARGIPYYRRSTMYHGLPIPGAIKLGKCIFVHDPGFSDPSRTSGRFGGSVVHGHDHQSHQLIRPTVSAGDIGVWSYGTLARTQQYYMHTRPSTHTLGYGIHNVARSGNFLSVAIPLIKGVSYLSRLHGSAA